MRVVYYYFPEDRLENIVQEILKTIGPCEVLKIFDSNFANIRSRYSIPNHAGPHLVSINNGILETIWNLTNE